MMMIMVVVMVMMMVVSHADSPLWIEIFNLIAFINCQVKSETLHAAHEL